MCVYIYIYSLGGSLFRFVFFPKDAPCIERCDIAFFF